MNYKHYLGDGVYADFDGYHVVLTTENGIEITNRICLDDYVQANLVEYRKRLFHQLEEEKRNRETLNQTPASQNDS
jgi:hypothetical protein